MPPPPPPRIQIQYPEPVVDAGRYPAKRTVGDLVEVRADVFRDGHDKLRAVAVYRANGERKWREAELHPLDADINGVRWGGSFVVDRAGRWEFSIEAWTDVFATWRDELRRKLEAGQHDLAGELSEGVVMLQDVAERAKGADRKLIDHALRVIADDEILEAAKHDAALGTELYAAVERNAERHGVTRLEPALTLEVDRVRARFGSWYEVFPRSWGGIAGIEAQVPALAELGFDVLYMTPIHPIGRTNRKGRNNALTAGPDDPGSPVRGRRRGGRPRRRRTPTSARSRTCAALCATAAEHGMDVAMDFAINASADHPWLTDHPDWFHRRPDGTLKYAENPPKRYQDIYNVNWECDDWRGLWEEWRRIFLFWVDCGVKVYRVDNPHTKPIPFWEWLIAEVHKVDRDVIFLAEAFTRRAVMRQLAKIGYTQGYTYFTWKNTPPRVDRIRGRAGVGAGAGLLPPELLPQHARHPQRIPGPRRPGRLLHALRARRHARARPTGSTPATSTTRTRRCARAPRSTWTRRSTRSSSASSTARCCRSSRASTRSGARTPRSSTSPTSPGWTPRTTS